MLHRHQRLAFEGSVHFVTTVAQERGSRFIEPDICELILDTFEFYRSKFGIDCIGYVLMPDHLHALLYQTSGELVIPKLMESFKRLTAKKLQKLGLITGVLWRRRYDDVSVPGTGAAVVKLQYMLENPVRAGLVNRYEEYPWSSACQLLAEDSGGIVTINKDLLPGG